MSSQPSAAIVSRFIAAWVGVRHEWISPGAHLKVEPLEGEWAPLSIEKTHQRGKAHSKVKPA